MADMTAYSNMSGDPKDVWKWWQITIYARPRLCHAYNVPTTARSSECHMVDWVPDVCSTTRWRLFAYLHNGTFLRHLKDVNGLLACSIGVRCLYGQLSTSQTCVEGVIWDQFLLFLVVFFPKRSWTANIQGGPWADDIPTILTCNFLTLAATPVLMKMRTRRTARPAREAAPRYCHSNTIATER